MPVRYDSDEDRVPGGFCAKLACLPCCRCCRPRTNREIRKRLRKKQKREESKPRIVMVTIPKGAKPGMTIRFQIGVSFCISSRVGAP